MFNPLTILNLHFLVTYSPQFISVSFIYNTHYEWNIGLTELNLHFYFTTVH